MKSKFIGLAILITGGSLHAGIFIGPTTATNKFLLTSNQVAVITAVYPQKQYDDSLTITNTVTLDASLVSGGQTNAVYIGECNQGTTALEGPAELVLNSPGVITYQTLINTPLHSQVIVPASTNVIDIPAGKSIKFLSFDLSGYTLLIANGQISSGGNVFQGADIYGGAEFSGPLTISFFYPDYISGFADMAYVVPYYLTDSSAYLPDQMVLQSATGNVEVQLQKSNDLTNWFSSVAIQMTNQTKTFYRLRVAN